MLNSKEIMVHTKDLNILLVEDHKDLRVNTAYILEKFFKTVDVAENGEIAFKKFKNNTNYYDIIISDIQMPKMNGIELTRNIYSIRPDQIIIILSAHDDSKYLHELLNLKIEHFLKKPIDFQDLLKALLNAAKHFNNINTSINKKINSTSIRLSDAFNFNRENNLLYDNSTIISLTKYEMIFMQILTSEIGKIYSNDDISNYYLKNNENLDAINIRKLVSKLRKKLPENIIESLYGVGYRLIPFL